MDEILPGVFHWTTVHPGIGKPVSSHWLDDGGVAIDPLLPDEGIEWFARRRTTPRAVVLSNRHHYRDAGRLAAEFGCPVLCIRQGLHEHEGTGRRVEPFDFGDELPGGIVVHEVGAICPDDCGLELRGRRALLFADGIVRGPAFDGELGFVPPELMDEPEQTRRQLLESLRRLLEEVDFDHVLLAHGAPLVGTGRAELEAFVRGGGRTAFHLG